MLNAFEKFIIIIKYALLHCEVFFVMFNLSIILRCTSFLYIIHLSVLRDNEQENSHRDHHERDRGKEREFDHQRERERERTSERERDHQRERGNKRESDHESERSSERDRDRERGRDYEQRERGSERDRSHAFIQQALEFPVNEIKEAHKSRQKVPTRSVDSSVAYLTVLVGSVCHKTSRPCPC